VLTLWRRHKSKCPHKDDRYFRKCRCAVWCEGVVESTYIRRSLKTRSWERAAELVREIEDGKKNNLTFKRASELFIADCESRKLQPSTLGKLKLLQSALQEFADSKGKKFLHQLDPVSVREFRAGWKEGALTQQKKLERMRSMFRWFVDADMIQKNPASGLKATITHETAVEPFSLTEQEKILATAYRLARTQEHKPKQLPVNPKTGTFAKFLLHTALRITDAATVTKDRIEGDRIFLYATKNKKPVTLPLPADLIRELDEITTHHLFPSPEGSERPETISDYWRDQLIKVFTTAEIKGGHPHRFRHTVAVNMLDQGSSVEDVALVLGNSPAIVAKHYSAFVQSRQARIDREIQKTWVSKKLVRVK